MQDYFTALRPLPVFTSIVARTIIENLLLRNTTTARICNCLLIVCQAILAQDPMLRGIMLVENSSFLMCG
jgi:hypothetical protein